ncbi:hypothetical protein [Hydrogenovibrio kuenenii]|uniref:hypothetical protein n=1 Tax=Hydrogenovibrio kuenenii TaxID=63658 RepID=UPI000463536A|nr:hypothetical protein [Hydrogenovibrio kuenenii]
MDGKIDWQEPTTFRNQMAFNSALAVLKSGLKYLNCFNLICVFSVFYVLPVKAEVKHSYSVTTLKEKYASSPDALFRTSTPSEMFASRQVRAMSPNQLMSGGVSSLTPNEMLIRRTQGFINQVSNTGEDSPRVLAILKQWKTLEPKLLAMAKKDSEVNELLHYLKGLKHVSDDLQPPTP